AYCQGSAPSCNATVPCMLLRQRYFALLGVHAMIKITSVQAIAAALLACGLSAAPAVALSNRTWVSGSSIAADSGACTRAAPCKTFAFAFSVTNAGGEIDVLDPAGYGPVTIAKAISIVNDGVGVATIGATSGSAITITAGATDSIHLRGLTILGLGTGLNGILFNSGGNLAIENCVIRGFTFAGINISPSTSGSFVVSNTIASNNPGLSEGILVRPIGSAVVTGVLSEVTANNNFFGIDVNGSLTTGAALNVTIVDSETSNNGNAGVFATAGATAVMVRNSVASNNSSIGLEAGANAILRVAHSVVAGNTLGVKVFSGGVLFSYGDNDIDGNTVDNTVVLTHLVMH
ncbi:MAG: right-handed parallel beta-helix repeat-containing protein, partial [Methylocella sp.]